MASFRRMLSERLDRLSITLSALRGRLHEALAASLGQAVSEAVREVVEAVLEGTLPSGSSFRRYTPDLWEARREDPWRTDAGGFYEEADEPEESAELVSARAERSRRALSAGLQAAAWWLRRARGRFTSTFSLGVGLAVAMVVYGGGPLAAAGAGLVGSALAVGALAGLARSGAALDVPS